jgi:hypothetical protein
VVAQPAAQSAAGVVAVAVPVPQPVDGDGEGDGLVVLVPQPGEQVRADGGLAAEPGVLDGCVCLPEDGDHLAGQACAPPGPSLVTARQRRMMCWLCRYRHNAHYADTVVMPIRGRWRWPAGVEGLGVSA